MASMNGRMGVGIGSGAISGAISGAAIGSYFPGYGTIIGAIVGAVLGATLGALGTVLSKANSGHKRHVQDIIETTTIRSTPVGLCFGRNRLGGQYIAVGTFEIWKDMKNDGQHGRVRKCNAIMALCEGTVQAMGNIRQDGRLIKSLRNETGFQGRRDYIFKLHLGTNAEAVDPLILELVRGYQTPYIPYRNTAHVIIYTIVGYNARLADFNFDVMGMDLTIIRNGINFDANPLDIAAYAFYDGFTESFCLVRSDATGMAMYPREGTGVNRTFTQPPNGVSPTKGWYLGRHDILIFQDPSTPGIFYIGYWGILPASNDWEVQNPSIEGWYDNAIIQHYLDEQHGILHTLHYDGTVNYILRWNLLTGRVDRLDTDLSGVIKAFIYSRDFDAYVAATTVAIRMLTADTGRTYKATSLIDPSSCLGLCAYGQLIGVVTATAFTAWDPYRNGITGAQGASATDLLPGSLGGSISAHQNSWTGHVTLVKTVASTAAFINFIPSCIEDVRDLNANGTSGLGGTLFVSPYQSGKPEPDFQTFPNPDGIAGWVRDWSWRKYNQWANKYLQGSSSLAAAMWAVLADENNLDSKRWGAGINPKYFSLGSFESVHAYCVGPAYLLNPDGTNRWAERYKFDFFLDQETSVAALVSDHMLMACQGYRSMSAGKMYVGIPRAGMWPTWHFSDSQTEDSQFGCQFLGRTQGVNRVRIQYRDVLDEYRHNFAEASDEFDINARGRIQQATLNVEGCGRYGHADILAKAVLDQSIGGRRSAKFKTHYLGFVIAPSDGIEVSNAQCALSRVNMGVTDIMEAEDGRVEITSVEHRQALEVIKAQVGNPMSPGGGELPPPSEQCKAMVVPISNGLNSVLAVDWFGHGVAYAPGHYNVNYRGGAYSPANDGSWNYAVAGWDVVTQDANGVVAVLGAAPGLTVSAPGYAQQDDAELANAGQTAVIVLAAQGPIGLRRTAAGNSFTLVNQAGPSFDLCPPSGGGQPPVPPPPVPPPPPPPPPGPPAPWTSDCGSCPPNGTPPFVAVTFNSQSICTGLFDKPDGAGSARITGAFIPTYTKIPYVGGCNWEKISFSGLQITFYSQTGGGGTVDGPYNMDLSVSVSRYGDAQSGYIWNVTAATADYFSQWNLFAGNSAPTADCATPANCPNNEIPTYACGWSRMGASAGSATVNPG